MSEVSTESRIGQEPPANELPANELPANELPANELPANEPRYAILASFYATFIALVSLLAISLIEAEPGDIGLGGLWTIAAFLPVAAVPIVVLCGLWQRRGWRRTVLLALQGLSLILGLASLAMAFVVPLFVAQSDGEFLATNTTALSVGLFGLAINSLVVTWFIRHREQFEEEANQVSEAQVEPEGVAV